jgi:hypothetical protein
LTVIAHSDGLGRLALLGTAIARRPLRVEAAKPGERAWTDGNVVFIDATKRASEQILSLAVQASLLSAGSLDGDVVRGLARRPALTTRYLAVEGHRALTVVEHLLPRSVRSLIRADVAALSGSAAASLDVARRGEVHLDPPESFGAIFPKRLLESMRAAARAQSQRPLLELAEEAITDDARGPLDASMFPNELAGGGALGKWLSKLSKPVRRLRGGGSPGGDAPTHFSRSGVRRGGAVFSSTALRPRDEPATKGHVRGTRYDEWDVHTRSYRKHWCTVLETEPSVKHGTEPVALHDNSGLRRSLARLGLGVDRYGRQPQGDDIDVDALVEARVEMMSGSSPDPSIFIDSIRRRRNLSVLVLLDISGSAAEPATNGETVHSQQRSAAAALTIALHQLGDRVALYAYRSQGRSSVHVMPVKRFGDNPGPAVLQRLRNLVPGAYSRLGAAIRHGTRVLQDHGGTPRQLLVVLSDGLAYDHGYEPAYGAADARRALCEARDQGVGCLCLTVGASTDAAALRRVFGAAAHASIATPSDLKFAIGPLFRSAIRSADIRRRLS